jgi:hypothetical protein
VAVQCPVGSLLILTFSLFFSSYFRFSRNHIIIGFFTIDSDGYLHHCQFGCVDSKSGNEGGF